MGDSPKTFSHEVSADLASLIPEKVRSEPKQREDWVNRALEIGLKAMVSGSGSVDLSFVSKEFDGWKDEIEGKLIGKDSEFENALNEWINDSEGSFQRAFDFDDPNSPLSKFMSQQTTDREEHEDSMTKLVEGIKHLVSKDSGPKQAKQMGDDFEDDIEWFLTNNKIAEDEVLRTGEKAIEGSGGVKKGDVGLLVGHPSADDLMITIEAKAGESNSAYALRGNDSLWTQMDKAMKTRPAKAAIGVVNIKNVKQHKPWLEQGRDKIVVAVDWENLDFTLLEIAYSLLRYRLIEGLSTKDMAATETKLDIGRFEDLIDEITSNKNILQTMRSNLTKIGTIIGHQDSQVTDIEGAINSQVKQLKMLLKDAQAVLD